MEGPDMHEVSLIESVVSLVEDERRRHGFSRVRVIHLRLGALGPAEPEALRFCFEAVAKDTVADGARLEIEMVPGEGWCSGCCRTVPLDERFADCPFCGNTGVPLTAGEELRVADMEVE
jgi:hydrogenase nickel incorporation protein HypA/HybF